MRQSMYWLKLPYFSNQSCLWGNTLLQDQKSLLNKPTQSDWKGGNISSMYPTSVKYPCVCMCVCVSGHVVYACVWSLHEGAGAEVMENCMCGCYWQRGDGLDGQLRGKLRSRPWLMKAESGLTEGNAREFGMGREWQPAKKRNETNCSIWETCCKADLAAEA